MYPDLQVHVNEPTVFVQVAFGLQPLVPFAHSFTSVQVDGEWLLSQVKPLSTAHEAHPSPDLALLSSQLSPWSRRPLPQVFAQTEGAPEHE
jgi:hypothetical protein